MKEKIIKELKIIKCLENNFMSNLYSGHPVFSEYKFCLNIFNKWCSIINVSPNYGTFYEFLSEYGELKIEDEESSIYLSYNTIDRPYIFNLTNGYFICLGLDYRIKEHEFYYLLE